MPNLTLATQLIETLPASAPGLFNPWRDWCDADDRANPQAGPEGRLQRLAAHLDGAPRYLLCGEAPGWQGCRYSGIGFTSERQLLDGLIPRMPALARRLTRESPHGGPFTEPSATIIWKTLHALGIAHDVVIWNALQLHAHRPGERWTNRTPTPAELELGAPALQIMLDTFPDAKVIAIGKKAEALLREMDVVPNGQVRHPANGGARAFADALRRLV